MIMPKLGATKPHIHADPDSLGETRKSGSLESRLLVPDSAVLAALALPPGKNHDEAFASAFECWMRTDPTAVTDWVLRLSDPHDFDQAAALLVIHTDTLQRPTSLALTWAEDLADPALRRLALAHVFREWSEQDRDAALRYVNTTSDLSAEERAALLSILNPHPVET